MLNNKKEEKSYDKEIKKLKLSLEDAANYEVVMALANAANTYTEEEIAEAWEKYFDIIPDDSTPEEALVVFFELAQKDPELLRKITVSAEILKEVSLPEPGPEVSKITLDDIKRDAAAAKEEDTQKKVKMVMDYINE